MWNMSRARDHRVMFQSRLQADVIRSSACNREKTHQWQHNQSLTWGLWWTDLVSGRPLPSLTLVLLHHQDWSESKP